MAVRETESTLRWGYPGWGSVVPLCGMALNLGNHLTPELGNHLAPELGNHLAPELGNHLALKASKLGNCAGPRHRRPKQRARNQGRILPTILPTSGKWLTLARARSVKSTI